MYKNCPRPSNNEVIFYRLVSVCVAEIWTLQTVLKLHFD